MDKKTNSGFSYIIVIAIIAAAAAIGLVLYLNYFKAPSPQNVPPAAQNPPAESPAFGASAASSSLGATIYEQANNPLQNKLPKAVPVANPLQGVYKNPFQ